MSALSLHALLPSLALLGAAAGASAQQVDWSTAPGGVAIAVDADDNVFTATYEQALGAEITVTKRDAGGSPLWTSSFDQTDATKWEQAVWLAADGEGDVIVCGTLKSGYSNPVNAASIVMKYRADGALAWRHVYEGTFDGSFVRRCLVDADDNIYVLGMGHGPAGFVAKVRKFAPDGAPLWSWLDGAGIGAPTTFKLTPDQALVISARSIFGSVNGYAKIDLDGAPVWSLPGVQSLTIGDAAGDVYGNTYVVHGNYAAGDGTVIKKLDTKGALLWQKSYATAGLRIEVGHDDHAVVTGYPSSGTAGAAFFKIDQDGGLSWVNLDADGPLMLLLQAQMLLDASNDAYLAAGTLFDVAVCKVKSDGTSAWTATTPGGYATGIALGQASNSVFVTGGSTAARIVDAGEGAWHDVGFALPGAAGAPSMQGSGVLATGGALSMQILHAPAAAPGALVVGASAAFLPILGGTLVPSPTLVLPLTTDAFGRAALTGSVGGVPAVGAQLWFQAWFLDPSAAALFSATSGLSTTTP